MSIATAWFEERFRELVVSWERHHDLRKTGASVPELAQSRLRLDTARKAITELRMAFAPEPNEQQLARTSAYCDTLGMVVYLYDRVDHRPAAYRCVCGNEVEPRGRGTELSA